MKTNYTIIATHLAYGTVTFTLDADDAKQAFTLWKQIVSSTKQWIVKRNEQGTACVTPTGQALVGPSHSDDRDLDEVDKV